MVRESKLIKRIIIIKKIIKHAHSYSIFSFINDLVQVQDKCATHCRFLIKYKESIPAHFANSKITLLFFPQM